MENYKKNWSTIIITYDIRDIMLGSAIAGPYQLPARDTLSPGQRNKALHKVGVNTSSGHSHGGVVGGGVGICSD